MSFSTHTPGISHTSRLGGWLPTHRSEVNRWLKNTIEAAEAKEAPFHSVIGEFRDMIEGDPVLRMYFTQMFQQQPRFVPPDSGDVRLKDYRQMLVVINHVLSTAPEYNTTGMVGFPINAILDLPMITPAGLAAFTMEKVNAMFHKVLIAWTEFLNSADSLYVLNRSPTGWLNPEAWHALHLDDFQMELDAPYLGFKSWNDFFIRKFKDGLRPVADLKNDSVIVSACESTPYAISMEVKRHDTFWIKSQPYSLHDMLAGQYVDEFEGGTVYQAFLSAKNYHRWHSPISGTIRKIQIVPGTYYAEAASEGFDPAGPNNSQGYIAHVATRALIFIEADNPHIGLIAVVTIGMAEVSSCIVTVKENDHVTKGNELGYFQFGGSSHCLVFKKGVIAQFAAGAIPQGDKSATVPVNSLLATANSTAGAGD